MPAIAANNEFYFVVWADDRDVQNEWDIYGARVTPEGRVLDPKGIRICALPGIQWYPSVASDGRNFFVVWSDGRYGLTSDIYGARVTADGVVLDLNGFAISDSLGAIGPSVAFNGSEYLATWYDYRNSAGVHYNSDIYGARIRSDGLVLDPEGLAICPAADMQSSPGVAALADNFFVAWSDSRGQVRGTGVTSAGAVNNPDGLVLGPRDSGYFIRVAANGSGYLTVWTDARNYDTTQYDIFARRADAAGQLIGTSDFVLCEFTDMQQAPAVAAANDQFLAVWLDERAGFFGTGIFGTRIAANGVMDTNGFRIGEQAYPVPLTGPAVASLNGQYLVAWVAGDLDANGPTDIVAKRVAMNGSVLDSKPFLVTTMVALDTDHDGVPDARDQCPDTPAGAVVDGNGCSIAQLCPCDGDWRNHGEYVNCISSHAWEFFRAGLITADGLQVALRDASKSDCGKRGDHPPKRSRIRDKY